MIAAPFRLSAVVIMAMVLNLGGWDGDVSSDVDDSDLKGGQA